MTRYWLRTAVLAGLIAPALIAADVPRTWRQSDVDILETPLANAKYSPVHIGEAAYYRIPERIIYKSYPVYRPGREPSGYMDWLKQRQPEISFDATTLKKSADWVAAGETV